MTTKLYSPAEINEMTEDRARKEYRRLQKIASQRIGRIEKYGIDFYIGNIPDVPLVSTLSTADVFSNLQEINAFLKNPFTQIRYVQHFENKSLEAYRAAGYTWINKKNIRQVNWLLGMIEKLTPSKSFNYDEALDYIEQMERLNISEADFKKNAERYLENFSIEDLQEMKPIKTGREMKFRDVIKRMGK